MRRDYYAVLGIAATAPPREVRRAYQRLARQYSPDVNFWDERARELFEEIAEAFRVLGDPAARQMYDQYGHAAGADEALAEGRRGDDVHAVVDLSFAEVVRGASVRLDVQRFSACTTCGASGAGREGRCLACQGRGVRRVVELVSVAVPAGVDSGARIRVPTPSGEAVLVVPPGTTGGQVFRLRGQGLPKLTGESTGDLHVTARVEVPTGLDARTHELVRELARLMPVETRTALERYRGGAE